MTLVNVKWWLAVALVIGFVGCAPAPEPKQEPVNKPKESDPKSPTESKPKPSQGSGSY